MKLCILNSNISMSHVIGDNTNFCEALRIGEAVALTDEDAVNMAESDAVYILTDISEDGNVVVAPSDTETAIERIPRLNDMFQSGRAICATPQLSEILRVFGIPVALRYPVHFPTIHGVIDNVEVPGMALVDNLDSITTWKELQKGRPSNRLVQGLLEVYDKYAMVWVTEKPSIHPHTLGEIVEALSEVYECILICGSSSLRIDLYQYEDYNTIDMIGRIGTWSEVVKFALNADVFITANHWLGRLANYMGVGTYILGACKFDEVTRIGADCIGNWDCEACQYEFCPAISCIEAHVDDGNVVMSIGGGQ